MLLVCYENSSVPQLDADDLQMIKISSRSLWEKIQLPLMINLDYSVSKVFCVYLLSLSSLSSRSCALWLTLYVSLSECVFVTRHLCGSDYAGDCAVESTIYCNHTHFQISQRSCIESDDIPERRRKSPKSAC